MQHISMSLHEMTGGYSHPVLVTIVPMPFNPMESPYNTTSITPEIAKFESTCTACSSTRSATSKAYLDVCARSHIPQMHLFISTPSSHVSVIRADGNCIQGHRATSSSCRSNPVWASIAGCCALAISWTKQLLPAERTCGTLSV